MAHIDKNDDDLLIRRAVAGDGPALATLLADFEPRLLRYAQKHLSPKVRLTASPEDVVQETCLEATRLVRGLEPRGRSKFYSWLLRIEHFRIKEAVQRHLRRVKIGTAATGFDDEASVIGAIEELAVYRRTPSRSAAAHEFMSAVERSLAKLPDHYRQVVIWRHIEGLSVEETAQRMGRDRAAVSVLTTRALAALRERLRSESRYI
jgi:RNA polymerase sigma-70 factor (ECF subfamily)